MPRGRKDGDEILTEIALGTENEDFHGRGFSTRAAIARAGETAIESL
jgi:hypothetical protein